MIMILMAGMIVAMMLLVGIVMRLMIVVVVVMMVMMMLMTMMKILMTSMIMMMVFLLKIVSMAVCLGTVHLNIFRAVFEEQSEIISPYHISEQFDIHNQGMKRALLVIAYCVCKAHGHICFPKIYPLPHIL